MPLAVAETLQNTRISADSDGESITIASGALVVVLTSVWNSSGSTATVSDGTAGTYTQAVTLNSGANETIFIHYFENHPGGTVTVTVNPVGSGADIDFVIVEVSGAATSGALDNTNTATGTTSTPAIASGALDQADEIIFAILTHTSPTQAITPDATYTQAGENENNSSGQCFNAQYKIVASSASDTADWSTTPAQPVSYACLATFKAAADAQVYIPKTFVRSDVMKALINL